MSETPRDQRALWREVSRTFEEFGEALRVHLSPDAARSPSDPTTPDGPGTRGPGTGPTGTAPMGGSAAAGGEADTTGGASTTGGAGTSSGTTNAGGAGTAGGAGVGDGVGAAPWADPAAGSPGRPGEGAGAADSDWIGPAGAGETAGSGSARPTDRARPDSDDPWAAATAADTPPRRSTTGPDDSAGAGAGSGDRRWREWTGGTRSGGSGGRFATQPDWDSARESVREFGRSAQRLATQAGDAARDPHVRDSAQRAARSLGDAIVTTVEDFATDLRNRMRNPRWSDSPRPPERPPVAPIEDDRDEAP